MFSKGSTAGTSGTSGTGTGRFSQGTKRLLQNVIRHTNAHNRVVEETEMWQQHVRQRELGGLDPSHPSYLHDDRFNDDRDGRMARSSDSWPVPFKREGSRHAHMDDEGQDRGGSAGVRRSTFWMRQLEKLESAHPDRWDHSGYKELYPDYFDSDRSVCSRSQSRGRKTSTRRRERGKKKKTQRSGDRKSKHKHRKSKKRDSSSSDSSSTESDDSSDSESENGHRPRSKAKKHSKRRCESSRHSSRKSKHKRRKPKHKVHSHTDSDTSSQDSDYESENGLQHGSEKAKKLQKKDSESQRHGKCTSRSKGRSRKHKKKRSETMSESSSDSSSDSSSQSEQKRKKKHRKRKTVNSHHQNYSANKRENSLKGEGSSSKDDSCNHTDNVPVGDGFGWTPDLLVNYGKHKDRGYRSNGLSGTRQQLSSSSSSDDDLERNFDAPKKKRKI